MLAIIEIRSEVDDIFRKELGYVSIRAVQFAELEHDTTRELNSFRLEWLLAIACLV